MARQIDIRLSRRPAAFAGLALALAGPAMMGAMLVHLSGFYPDTGLSTGLRTGGLLLAVLPVAVVAVDLHRARRARGH